VEQNVRRGGKAGDDKLAGLSAAHVNSPMNGGGTPSAPRGAWQVFGDLRT